ncbi:DMT family transporter [Cryobacterium sp. PH31-AA6]|uniref:DMT family transporter n=1 Tax=Cryobacterium sp. PH31-AA6 TaxID=3046205 RepID=UPI0024BBB34B|nr:DMT family transporter [Cryobacterium sp. PH31-AA6]MDJ0325341.1 DMT family transporter [Cryobacterium sp. PH31-AA6]
MSMSMGMNTGSASLNGRGLALGAQYLGAAAVWGASFLFIKVAVEGLSPAQLVLGRLLFGALVLAGIMLATRRRWPRGLRVWSHLTAIGAIMCVAPFLLFSWAAQYLPSGLSSIYNATTPIVTMLVALAILPDERLTRIKTAGLFVAAGGVLLVAAPWTAVADASGDMFFWAQLACLGGTTCYGLGFSYTRRFLRGYPYDAVTVSAAQIGAGAVLILLLTPFIGMTPISITPGIAVSVIVLGGIGTGIAYIWYTNVINAWGATNASTVTYLTPIGGVILGVLVLGETILWNQILGGIIVVVAILVSQGRLRLPRDSRAKKPSRRQTEDDSSLTSPPAHR